jgi:hypothetical protein
VSHNELPTMQASGDRPPPQSGSRWSRSTAWLASVCCTSPHTARQVAANCASRLRFSCAHDLRLQVWRETASRGSSTCRDLLDGVSTRIGRCSLIDTAFRRRPRNAAPRILWCHASCRGRLGDLQIAQLLSISFTSPPLAHSWAILSSSLAHRLTDTKSSPSRTDGVAFCKQANKLVYSLKASSSSIPPRKDRV